MAATYSSYQATSNPPKKLRTACATRIHSSLTVSSGLIRHKSSPRERRGHAVDAVHDLEGRVEGQVEVSGELSELVAEHGRQYDVAQHVEDGEAEGGVQRGVGLNPDGAALEDFAGEHDTETWKWGGRVAVMGGGWLLPW